MDKLLLKKLCKSKKTPWNLITLHLKYTDPISIHFMNSVFWAKMVRIYMGVEYLPFKIHFIIIFHWMLQMCMLIKFYSTFFYCYFLYI